MKKIMFSLIVVVIVFISSNINAEVIEIWKCYSGYEHTPSVKAFVNKGRKTGFIEVAGIKYDTEFRVEGFDRIWSFGLRDDNCYQFLFVINPGGKGLYYNFKKLDQVKPSLFFNCNK